MTKPKLAVETPEGRMYVHPITGQAVYSVTNITKGGIPKDLANWAAKCSAQWVLDNHQKVAEKIYMGQFDELFKEIASAHERVRDTAAAKGDMAHDSAEAFVKGKDDGRSPAHMTQLNDFFTHSGLIPIYTEVTVWHGEQGYAGTLDLLARDEEGRVYLIDYKTGKNVWAEHMVQLEALARCPVILWPDGTEEDLPHIDVVGVLHLRPKSWAWWPNEDVDAADRNWKCFKAAQVVSEWKRFHPNMVFGPLGRVTKATWATVA